MWYYAQRELRAEHYDTEQCTLMQGWCVVARLLGGVTSCITHLRAEEPEVREEAEPLVDVDRRLPVLLPAPEAATLAPSGARPARESPRKSDWPRDENFTRWALGPNFETWPNSFSENPY